jgi:hypothetical protein
MQNKHVTNDKSYPEMSLRSHLLIIRLEHRNTKKN